MSDGEKERKRKKKEQKTKPEEVKEKNDDNPDELGYNEAEEEAELKRVIGEIESCKN